MMLAVLGFSGLVDFGPNWQADETITQIWHLFQSAFGPNWQANETLKFGILCQSAFGWSYCCKSSVIDLDFPIYPAFHTVSKF